MKYVLAFTSALVVIVGWNVFLIQRDVQLLKVYDANCQSRECVK